MNARAQRGAISSANNYQTKGNYIGKNPKWKPDITIPMLAEPRPSSTGKSIVVATTGGFATTTAQVKRKPVLIALNAVIK